MFRTSIAFLVVIGFSLASRSVQASPPDHEAIFADTPPVVLRIDDPLRVRTHPLVTGILENLNRSGEWERFVRSPDLESVLQLRDLVETRFGTDWATAIERMTDGGISVALPSLGSELPIVLVTSDTPETAGRLVELIVTLAEVDGLQKDNPVEFARSEAKGRQRLDSDRLYLLRDGSLVAITYDPDHLDEIANRLDRLVDSSTERKAGDVPLARLTVDLDALREVDEFAEFLTVPRTDQVSILGFLGGYVDLLRRGSTLTVTIDPSDDQLAIIAEVDANRADITPGLEGYFASTADQSAAPPLRLPGLIYSDSWYRDYELLWQQRDRLLTEEGQANVTEFDEMLQKQLSVIGLKALPSDIVRSLGTDWRVALARQETIPYAVQPPNRFPAAVFVVDLPDDEVFRKRVSSFLRTFRLIFIGTSAQNGGAVAKQEDYKGATLDAIVYKDDERAATKGGKVRFNFSPTTTITRGHFVIGTTRQIVRDVVDFLDAEDAADAGIGSSAENSTTVTGQTVLDVGAVASNLRDFHAQLVSQLSLSNGFMPGEADHELNVAYDLLRGLGEVTLENQFHSDRFELRLTITGETDR